MNREIKFRAWHAENKEMVNFNNEKLCTDEYQRLHLAMLMAGKYGDVLMQYTGLKDENGADVYDGDIVRDEEGYLSQIYWHERDFMWCVSEIGGLCELAGSSFVVVGNIHQNPELVG